MRLSSGSMAMRKSSAAKGTGSSIAKRTASSRRSKGPRPTPETPAAAGYSGTPLPKKLGIRPGSRVRLVDAPRDFGATLGELPEEASLMEDFRGEARLTLWFLRSRAELERGMAKIVAHLGEGSVWMIWPKKSSRVLTDLTEQVLREAGLARGLVDYKVCAVDATWSGLLFTRRKAHR
jgi:hypothetical protein